MLKKVLVVDDSELIHSMYRLILKRYRGCTFVKAMNGKEALEKLATEDAIDLILLDMNMSVMNGIQFLENIKSGGVYTHIPVIIISIEGKEKDIILRGMELGAKGYTVVDCRGGSIRTPPEERKSMVRIEAIVSPSVGSRILCYLADEILDEFPVAISTENVEVIQGDYF